MSCFEKWSEAEFEARLRELDIVGPAFSRAFAHLSGFDDEDEEEQHLPLSLRDWLNQNKEEEVEFKKKNNNKKRTDGPHRAAEVRLERLCIDHERRLQTLFEKYARDVSTQLRQQQQQGSCCVANRAEEQDEEESEEEEEVQNFRTVAEELERRRRRRRLRNPTSKRARLM